MGWEYTRRDFLKASSIATAGVALSHSFAGTAHAAYLIDPDETPAAQEEIAPEEKATVGLRINAVYSIKEGRFIICENARDGTPHDPDSLMYNGSIQKVATSIPVFEAIEDGDIDVKAKNLAFDRQIRRHVRSTYVSNYKGKFSVDDALHGADGLSLNDMAWMLAIVTSKLKRHEARIKEAAAHSPNEKFKPGDEYTNSRVVLPEFYGRVGADRTVTSFAHGLPHYMTGHPEHPDNVTTLNDQMKIAAYLVTVLPQYLHYFNEPTIRVPGEKRDRFNTNNLLHNAESPMAKRYRSEGMQEIPGVKTIGLKTAKTNASGLCLETVFEMNGETFIAYVAGRKSAKERDKDMYDVIKRAREMLPNRRMTFNQDAPDGQLVAGL